VGTGAALWSPDKTGEWREKHLKGSPMLKERQGWALVATPVILATQEAGIRRIVV
jgi:hypothetical protein